MHTPELLTVQKYAAKNRLSIHTVVKKTMTGELETLTRDEGGKEITYIVVNNVSSTLHSVESEEAPIDYKQAYEDLHQEYLILKTKYQKLLSERGK